MFLMFHLGRPDVVSGGDLGIRRAIQVAYGLDEMPTPIEVAARAEAWRPNRTLACIYLWESLSAAPVE
jgi:DNA-3-methyladenine glycosylase II